MTIEQTARFLMAGPAGDQISDNRPTRGALIEEEWRYGVAWHEACHVVMAYLSGANVIEASINKRGASAGYVMLGHKKSHAEKAAGRDWFYQKRPKSEHNDLRRAIAIINAVVKSRARARVHIRRLYQETRETLTANHSTIGAVSRELVRHGCIGERQILRVLRKSRSEFPMMQDHDRRQREEWEARMSGATQKRRLRGVLPD